MEFLRSPLILQLKINPFFTLEGAVIGGTAGSGGAGFGGGGVGCGTGGELIEGGWMGDKWTGGGWTGGGWTVNPSTRLLSLSSRFPTTHEGYRPEVETHSMD